MAFRPHLKRHRLQNPPSIHFKDFWENDKNAKYRYQETLKFFENRPGAHAAARFMALSGLYVTNPDVNYLMIWTQKELKANSGPLMEILEEKRDQIYANTFINESFLNLAYQLDVEPERKVRFTRKRWAGQ